MGTNSSIMCAASGGNHSDTSPRGPRDHARSGLDLACYACRISSHGKSPVSNWLRCTCSRNSTSCSVSGGSPLYHIPLDPRGRAEVTRSARHSHSRVVQSPRSASSISATDFMQPQVVESQQVVVGTNTPFHPHQPLDLRLHPRPRSPSGLPCESARDVNSTPKHGDGSGNGNRHADLVPFPRHALRTNDSACGADPDTAPQGNPVATSRIRERVSPDQAEQHRQPVSDGSVSASNSFGSVVAGHRLLKTQSPPLEEASAANTAATTLMEPLPRNPESHSPSGQESVATIDFAKQFYLHRLHGIDAQVDRMVATETDWVARLRTILPPASDLYTPLPHYALQLARSNQALEKRREYQTTAVNYQTTKRELELQLSTVAEGHLISKGYDSADISRRRRLLELQLGGHGNHGDWVTPPRDGGVQLLRRGPLYQESAERAVGKVVSNEATAQVEWIIHHQRGMNTTSDPECQADKLSPSAAQPPSLPASPPWWNAEQNIVTPPRSPSDGPTEVALPVEAPQSATELLPPADLDGASPSVPPSAEHPVGIGIRLSIMPKDAAPLPFEVHLATTTIDILGRLVEKHMLSQREQRVFQWGWRGGAVRRISCCGEMYDAGGLGNVPGGGSSLYDAGIRAGDVVLVSLNTQVAVSGPSRKAPSSPSPPAAPPLESASTLVVRHKGFSYHFEVYLSWVTVAGLFALLLPRIAANDHQPGGASTLHSTHEVLHIEIGGTSWTAGGTKSHSTTLSGAGCQPNDNLRARSSKPDTASVSRPAEADRGSGDNGDAGKGGDDGSDDGEGGKDSPVSAEVAEPVTAFAPGDSVWYVKTGVADRPASVVAVHIELSQPSYTIQFRGLEETRNTEPEFLRHPVVEDSEVIVHFGFDTATMHMPLDSTTSGRLLTLLAVYFRSLPGYEHSAVECFKFLDAIHPLEDADRSRYLSELGMRSGCSITALAERPPSGDSPLPPPETLSIILDGVQWDINREELESHVRATMGTYGRMYHGQGANADYATVLVPCDQAWMEFYRGLPTLRTTPSVLKQSCRNLSLIISRGHSGMAPGMSTPPQGDTTVNMLFANLLHLIHSARYNSTGASSLALHYSLPP